MEYFDMYGQPIQFKYKNSFYYPTNCGVCISIFVILIIIIYLILFIIDITKMNTPTVLNVPESKSPSPLYNLIPDYIGFFDEINSNSIYIDNDSYDRKLPSLFKNRTDFGYQQFMFGIKKGNEWVKINNSIFNIIVYNYNKGEKNQLFYSNCKRVPHVKDTMFVNYNLSQVYCIYSPIQISHENESYIEISVKKCDNTYSQFNLTNFPPYNDLKNLVNGKLYDENIESEAFIGNFSNSNNNITCDTNIENITSNYKFYFIYVSSIFNQTEKKNPIVRVIDWKYTSFGNNVKTQLNAYFQINSLTSFKSVIPKKLGGKNETETFVSFDEEKYSNTPDDNDESDSDDDKKEIISVTIKSSDFINNYERSYITIFEIIGQVGGLSKFIIIVGGVFFLIGKLFDFEESMINDFYHVVDPKFNDKTQRNFEDFLDEISKEKYNEKNEDKNIKKKEKEEKKKDNEDNENKSDNNDNQINEESESDEDSKIKKDKKKQNKEIKEEEDNKNLYVNEKEKIFINFFREKLNELLPIKNNYYNNLKKNENEIENKEEKKEEE